MPIDRVALIQCDTALTPDQGTTSGAQSHPANFNTANLALAGATAREALVRLAASDWVSRSSSWPSATGSSVRDRRRRQRVSYGDLVGGRRSTSPSPEGEAEAAERVDGAWHAGQAPRHAGDGRPGELEFVHNVRVPGMLHGRVVRPPTVGATLVSVDEASVARHAGRS